MPGENLTMKLTAIMIEVRPYLHRNYFLSNSVLTPYLLMGLRNREVFFSKGS